MKVNNSVNSCLRVIYQARRILIKVCKNLYNLCNDLGKTIHGFQTGLLTMWLGLLTLNFRSPKGSLKFFLGSSLGKGTLFIYPLSTKWYPFHISNLELCIPFNCCECICLKTKNKPQTRTFHSHRIHLSALQALFTNQNDRFHFAFHILQLVKSLHFHT